MAGCNWAVLEQTNTARNTVNATLRVLASIAHFLIFSSFPLKYSCCCSSQGNNGLVFYSLLHALIGSGEVDSFDVL